MIKDKRIDAYITHAQDFAQPILNHLRKLVHEACPDVTETMKWSFPNFIYHGILCGIAAFKQHCAFGFWKQTLMNDHAKILSVSGSSGMGSLGKIKSLSEIS